MCVYAVNPFILVTPDSQVVNFGAVEFCISAFGAYTAPDPEIETAEVLIPSFGNYSITMDDGSQQQVTDARVTFPLGL